MNPARSLDLHLPLSLLAQTPTEHLRRLAARQEELDLEVRKLPDGSRGYEIRGRVPGEFQGDSIEAMVLVASNDFRILEEAFIIAARRQLKACALTAVKSEVLRAQSVDPAVFRPDRLLAAGLSTRQQEIVRRTSEGSRAAKPPALKRSPQIDPDLAVRVHHALHVALVLLPFTPLAYETAYAQRATISGRIADQAGAVIPGARITAFNLETGIKAETFTNEEGYYVIPYL